MSQVTQPRISIPTKVRSPRTAWLGALLALAACAAVVLVLVLSNESTDNAASGPSATPSLSTSVGGPNEAARGQAAAGAAGASSAVQPTAGPNEAARGQAAASAAGTSGR
ncbi:MAG: hypothetical protein ACRDLS_14405 [Solirubrobacteraceae bacterium]